MQDTLRNKGTAKRGISSPGSKLNPVHPWSDFDGYCNQRNPLMLNKFSSYTNKICPFVFKIIAALHIKLYKWLCFGYSFAKHIWSKFLCMVKMKGLQRPHVLFSGTALNELDINTVII